MPSPQVEAGAASQRPSVSREFLVRQAVLNAGAKRFPVTHRIDGSLGSVGWLHHYTEAGVPRLIADWVLHEYRILTSQYSVAA